MRKYVVWTAGIGMCFLLLSGNALAGNWDVTEYQKKENPYYNQVTGEEIKIEFENGSFEKPNIWEDDFDSKLMWRTLDSLLASLQSNPNGISGYCNYYHQSLVDGWNATPVNPDDQEIKYSDFIEIQRGTYGMVSDYNFNAQDEQQYAELNCVVPTRLYQICQTQPGQKVYYEYYHRGYKGGVDTMNFYLYDWENGNGIPPADSTKYSKSDVNDWKRYYGAYTIPAGQTETVFAFESENTAEGKNNLGNFLDAISLAYPSFLEADQAVDTGRIDENGEMYALVGDIITYTIMIENNGEIPSSRTMLKDVLPDGVKYQPDTLQMEYKNTDGTTFPMDVTGRVMLDNLTDTLQVRIGEIVTDSSNTHSNGSGTIGEGCAVTVIFQAEITGEGVLPGDMLYNQAYVSYNDLGYEEFNIDSENKLQDEWNVSDVTAFPLLDRGSLRIEKQLPEEVVNNQNFVFRISYRQNSTSPVSQTFYAAVNVAAQEDAGEIWLEELVPGIYTVMELKANWIFTIADPLLQIQTDCINGRDKRQIQFSYVNQAEPVNWIYGADSVVNRIKNE